MSNVKLLDSNTNMVAVGTSQYFKSIFSRFIFSQSSMSTDNVFSDITNYLLEIKGIMIKNKNNIFALFNDVKSNRILLGAVDISSYSITLKRTLPPILHTSITKNIFINENLYYVAAKMNNILNTLYRDPSTFSFS